jgi:diguanylate cyclase
MRNAQPARWAGTHWWGLTATGVGAVVAAIVACLGFHVGGPRTSVRLDDLAETGAALAAAGAAGFAAARHRGRYRIAWALLGASALSWGLGQGAWDWYELLQDIPVPFPSAADAGYLGAVPLAIAGVLSFPVSFERARSVLHTLLDGMLIAAALLVVSWETVLGAVYRAGADTPLAMVLSLMYPLSDVAIFTMIMVRLGRSPRRGRVTLLLVAAGLALLAVADSSFAYFTASGAYASGNLLDNGWVAGYLLIGLAALRSLATPAREAPPLAVASRWQQVLPYPPVLAALGVIIAERVTTGTIDVFTFWTMLAIVVLVLARQYLALGANVALVGTLAAREREMAYQAHHDALTGLANRVQFRNAVTLALNSDGSVDNCAVLFIDLDDFKQVNDIYGHAVGDSVLRLVAERLKANLRPDDTAARLGGDEFAVLIEKANTSRQVDTIAERILKALREPAAVQGRLLPVRGTIGIALADSTVHACEELLRRADVAMYEAKRQGKDRCAVFRVIAA